MSRRGNVGARAGALAVLSLMAPLCFRPAASSESITPLPGTRGVPRSRSTAGEYSRWLAGHMDLVFVGEFRSHERGLVRCRVVRPLRGMATDSIVAFSRLVTPSFSAERLRSGSRVLASVARQCTHDGLPCGDFYVIADDTLLSDYSSQSTAEAMAHDPRPLRFSDLDTVLISGRDFHVAIEGSDAIAIAGLIGPTANGRRRVPTAGGTFEVIGARWLVHGSASTPRYVSFPAIEDCYRGGGGWLYLLPVPRGFRSDTLALDVCARTLAARDAECLALGVPVDSLPRHVRRTERGLSLVRRQP